MQLGVHVEEHCLWALCSARPSDERISYSGTRSSSASIHISGACNSKVHLVACTKSTCLGTLKCTQPKSTYRKVPASRRNACAYGAPRALRALCAHPLGAPCVHPGGLRAHVPRPLGHCAHGQGTPRALRALHFALYVKYVITALRAL